MTRLDCVHAQLTLMSITRMVFSGIVLCKCGCAQRIPQSPTLETTYQLCGGQIKGSSARELTQLARRAPRADFGDRPMPVLPQEAMKERKRAQDVCDMEANPLWCRSTLHDVHRK